MTPEEVQALAALEAAEWGGPVDPDSGGWCECPVCCRSRWHEHKEDCALKAALDALRAKRAGSSGAAVAAGEAAMLRDACGVPACPFCQGPP